MREGRIGARYWTFDVERELPLSVLEKAVCVACGLLIFGRGWETKGWIWNNLLSTHVTEVHEKPVSPLILHSVYCMLDLTPSTSLPTTPESQALHGD
jgi:hypothetical protein